ncbi:MAG: sugar phosphate isomerase/epimerase [Kiritimatiellae bacterium]|nr:sugar phosphate isomerase/epimerase [Kiritimatiellia bacterium]
MKYGAHIYVWVDTFGDAELACVLDRAAALNLSFVEIPVGDDSRFDPRRLGAHAAERGLELVLSPGGLWPMDCDLSLGDAGRRRTAVAWHSRMLDLCGECGAVAYTGALYGHPGRIADERPGPAERERIARGLHALAEHARARGAKLVLEPMSHFRTHVVNTPEQANALLKLADHPNLFVLFDTYHACTEIRSYSTALSALMPRLWGIHACENHRGAPGTGHLPWGEIARTLSEAGWDGWIGLESYNTGLRNGAFAWSRGLLHDVCPDGDAFVRKGLAFLRRQFRECSRSVTGMIDM